jgi:hypothetical protein
VGCASALIDRNTDASNTRQKFMSVFIWPPARITTARNYRVLPI